MQHKLLQQWFGVYRWFYNRTIDYCEENRIYGYFTVSKNMRDPATRKFILPEWAENLKISPRIITGAIKDCCAAYKANFENFRNGNINHFNMGYKTKKDLRQCLSLQHSCFGKKGVLSSFKLGYIRGLHKQKESLYKVNVDSKICYHHKKYFLHIPYPAYKESKVTNDENQVKSEIGLDPGVRTFLTGYCPNHHVVELGKQVSNTIVPILLKCDKIRKIASKRTRKAEKRKLYKRMEQIYNKIFRKIDDMHWKIINYLTLAYGKITIGELEIKRILKSKKLKKISKRVLSACRHYDFRKKLIYKCKVRNIELNVINESYTTKSCTNCGELNHNLGSDKVFICNNCNMIADRDFASARNMIIKNYSIGNQ